MKKQVITSGKRKRAVATSTISQGTGIVKVNKIPLDKVTPELSRMRILEPLMLAGEVSKKIDASVKIRGGGMMSQADAARLALARGLVEYTKDKKLEKIFLDYDRMLLVADVRRKETRKPNDSKARAARQKSYR